eukprot:403340626
MIELLLSFEKQEQSYIQEDKNLLHLAIRFDNLELVRNLLSNFGSKSFYERATDGTYPALEALKSQNLEIRRIIHDYIQYKEVQEFMEEELKVDPSMPEKLLLLKKQLFPSGAQMIEPYSYKIQEITKAKRQKSLGKPTLENFDKYAEHLEYRRMTETDKKRRMLLHKNNTFINQGEPIIGNHKRYDSTKLGSDLSKNDSVLGNSSKFLDNADFKLPKSLKIHVKSNASTLSSRQRSLNTSYSHNRKQQSSSELPQAPQSNKIMASIQFYINKMLVKQGPQETVDEMQEYIVPIINSLTQQKVKYNDLNTNMSLDPNKMTISQKKEYENHKKQKNKVFKQLAKDYSNKLKTHQQAKKTLNQDQNDVDRLLTKSPGKKKTHHRRTQSKNSNQSIDKTEKQSSQNTTIIQNNSKIIENNEGGFTAELNKQKTKILINQLDQNESQPSSPQKLSRLSSNNQQKRALTGQNTGQNSSRGNSESSPKTLKIKTSSTPKNIYILSPNLIQNKSTIKIPASQTKQSSGPKSFVIKSKIQRQVSMKSKISPTPKSQAGGVIQHKVPQFLRRSTITPQALNNVRLNLRAIRMGKSGSSEQFSSGRDSNKNGEKSTSTDRNKGDRGRNKVRVMLNLSSQNLSEFQHNQKHQKSSYRSLEEIEQPLDSERNDVVLQLGNLDKLQEQYMELNKIDEVSQLLESGSPQISPKIRNHLQNYSSDNYQSNQAPPSKFLRLIKADSIYTDAELNEDEILASPPQVQEYDDSQDNQIIDIEQKNRSKVNPYITPKLDDKNPLPVHHHIKNIVSDQCLKSSAVLENTQQFTFLRENEEDVLNNNNGFNEASQIIQHLKNQQKLNYNLSNKQLQFSPQSQNIRQLQPVGSRSAINQDSNKNQTQQQAITDDYKSMFSGMSSNIQQKPEVKSYIKNKIPNTQQIKNSIGGLLPPYYPNKHLRRGSNDQSSPIINQHNMFIPQKLLHTSESFRFNKYRYKDEEEAKKIQKVVQNVNIIRYLKGSPLRLYPELFQQQKQRIGTSLGTTPKSPFNFLKENSSLLKTQNYSIKHSFNRSQKRQQEHKNSIMSQKENFNNRKKSIIQKNMTTFKQGLALGKASQYQIIQHDVKPFKLKHIKLQANPQDTIFGNFQSEKQIKSNFNYDYDIHHFPPNNSNAILSPQNNINIRNEEGIQDSQRMIQSSQSNLNSQIGKPKYKQSFNNYQEQKDQFQATFGDMAKQQFYKLQIEELRNSQSDLDHQNNTGRIQTEQQRSESRGDDSNTNKHLYLYKKNMRLHSDLSNNNNNRDSTIQLKNSLNTQSNNYGRNQLRNLSQGDSFNMNQGHNLKSSITNLQNQKSSDSQKLLNYQNPYQKYDTLKLNRENSQQSSVSPKNSNNASIVHEVNNDQYELLNNTHEKMLDTLHAHPNMKTILNKEKSYYKKLKNSEINVPVMLNREMKKIQN